MALLAVLMLLEAAVFLTVLYRLSSQNLAISNKNVQLSTIGDMYLSIQDIDLRADSIQLIRKRHGNDEDDLVGSGQTSARGMLKKVCEGVDEESKPVMELFVDLDTLPERLTNADTLAVEYLSDQQLWCRARFIVADRDANGNVVRVLWLIESIDEEKKHRDELKSLSETDPMTGVRSKHAFLIFGDIRKRLRADACEEDAARIDTVLTKDELMRWMEQEEDEALTCRLMRGGESVPYALLRVETRGSDCHRIVIGLRPE